jgi:hypothetical protein
METVAQDLLESMQFMVDHMVGNAEGKTLVVEVAAANDGLGIVEDQKPADVLMVGGE